MIYDGGHWLLRGKSQARGKPWRFVHCCPKEGEKKLMLMKKWGKKGPRSWGSKKRTKALPASDLEKKSRTPVNDKDLSKKKAHARRGGSRTDGTSHIQVTWDGEKASLGGKRKKKEVSIIGGTLPDYVQKKWTAIFDKTCIGEK